MLFDYVIVGAGNPADLPEMIRTLARGDDIEVAISTFTLVDVMSVVG